MGKHREIPNISWPKLAFLQFFCTIFPQIMDFTSRISPRIVDCVIIHQNQRFRNWIYFLNRYSIFTFSASLWFYLNATLRPVWRNGQDLRGDLDYIVQFQVSLIFGKTSFVITAENRRSISLNLETLTWFS